MSAERMRQEFEAWWSATMNTQEMDLHRFVGGGYACHETNRAWMAWQASRAAQQLVMPVSLAPVSADYDRGWADHAAEVRRLNAELLDTQP